MNRVLRVVSFLILFCMIFVLSGCNNPENTNANSNAQSNSKNQFDITAANLVAKYKNMKLPKINDGKPITIRVDLQSLNPSLSQVPTAEQPTVFNSTRIIEKEFKLLYPNVTIQWERKVDTSSAEALMQYLTVQLNANLAPDIVFAWGTSVNDQNWFYDFGNDLNKPNPFVNGNEKWRDQFPDYFFYSWVVSDYLNRVLSIPITVTSGTSTALYCNNDVFSKANASFPKTWEQLFTSGNAIRNAGFDTFGLWSGNKIVTTGLWDVQFNLGPYYAAAHKELFDYNGDGSQEQNEVLRASYEGHYLLKNDYAQNMWQQVKRKYSQLLSKGYQSIDYNQEWFLDKLGIIEDGLWRYPDEMSNTSRDFNFSVIPPPSISNDTTNFVNKLEYTEKGPYHPRPGISFNILLPSAKAHGGQPVIDACVSFLQFLLEPDNNNLIIADCKGSALGFLKGSKIPQELKTYFNQPFPITPQYGWPDGFTSEGKDKMSKILQQWIQNNISDQDFYNQFDAAFEADIQNYINSLKVDTSGWKKGW